MVATVSGIGDGSPTRTIACKWRFSSMEDEAGQGLTRCHTPSLEPFVCAKAARSL